MNKDLIHNMSMRFEVKFESNEKCKLVYDSLKLESNYDPNERASAKLEQEGSTLILEIEAKDSVSARASANSFFKWINLAIELISYLDKSK